MNDLPNEYQYPSYASAAGATTTNCNNSVDSTQISSPTVSNYKDWQTEKQELESQIRKQASQIEHIQAELQAKENRSKDLEERLADALELAHTRDLRHVEMMEKFEILMRSHNQLEPRPVSATAYASKVSDYESSLENNQFTPPRRNLSHTLPPSKKANTNASPQNPVYNIFKQTTERHTQHRLRYTQSRISDDTMLTQPMDTDDVALKPPPEAKSGKKIE